MAVFTTSQGRSVRHYHVGDPDWYPELSAADVQHCRDIVAGFTSAVEVDQPTMKFNCHGFAFAEAHAFFLRPGMFEADDVFSIPFASARKGDIVSYRNASGTHKHSAIVEQVSNGKIVRLRSKWGSMATVLHDLNGVPAVYGKPKILYRRNP